MAQDDAVVKVIELVGSSDRSFSDAVRNAVAVASRSLRNITGVEVLGSTADVDESGQLSRYKVNCKIAFVVEAARVDMAGMEAEAPSGLELTGGGAQNEEDMALGGQPAAPSP